MQWRAKRKENGSAMVESFKCGIFPDWFPRSDQSFHQIGKLSSQKSISDSSNRLQPHQRLLSYLTTSSPERPQVAPVWFMKSHTWSLVPIHVPFCHGIREWVIKEFSYLWSEKGLRRNSKTLRKSPTPRRWSQVASLPAPSLMLDTFIEPMLARIILSQRLDFIGENELISRAEVNAKWSSYSSFTTCALYKLNSYRLWRAFRSSNLLKFYFYHLDTRAPLCFWAAPAVRFFKNGA
jgi:hypothetical protein